MDSIDVNGLKLVFGKLRQIMDKNRAYLIELDGVMGDSDLGITMQKAFTAADEVAQEFTGPEVGKLLSKIGMKIAQAAPSTMGTLLARGFMKGGKAVSEAHNLSLSELALFFRAFTQAIMDAGKTRPGNKTIVDSLLPATEALEKAAAGNLSLENGLSSAYQASLQGVEDSKAMKAEHGRAAYYQEKSIGVQDPGATVGSLLFKGFYNAAQQKL